MAPLLRSRKQCFYCGQRSTQPNLSTSGSFKCQQCQAVNYLDKDGNITDPPLREVSSSDHTQRFAKTPASMSPDSNLFCDNCLKNQQISTGILSQYLPEPHDPQYAQKAANYPQFKKDLDARYPPVCLDCEPRVRERLRQQGYLAKTDHLKRLMERTRQKRVRPRWSWRNRVVRLGGLTQFVSALTYIFWSLSVVIAGLKEGSSGMELSSQNSVWTCIREFCFNQPISSSCLRSFSDIAGWGVLLGILSMWWNPKWQYKLEGNFGRLKGLTRYYRLHFFIHLIRSAVWLVCLRPQYIDSRIQWAIHVVASPILLLLTVNMLSSIRIEISPIKTWQTDIPPLVEPDGFTVPRQTSAIRNQPKPTFPIANLAPKEVKPEPYAIPPSPANDAEESMEWEPSVNHTFRPTLYENRYPQRVVQPSPFYGRLPPKPTNHFLQKHADALPPPKEPIGLSPGHFDRPQAGPETIETPGPSDFAHPTFFPSNDLQSDTGLEAIFTKVFSFDDSLEQPSQGTAQPAVAASSSKYPTERSSNSRKARQQVQNTDRFLQICRIVALTCVLMLWVLGFFEENNGRVISHRSLLMISTGSIFTIKWPILLRRIAISDIVLTLIAVLCSSLVAYEKGFLSISRILDHLIAIATVVELYLQVSGASDLQQSAGQGDMSPKVIQSENMISTTNIPTKAQIPSPPTTPTSHYSTDSDSDTASHKTWRTRNPRQESPGISLSSLQLNNDSPFGGRSLRSMGAYGAKRY